MCESVYKMRCRIFDFMSIDQFDSKIKFSFVYLVATLNRPQMKWTFTKVQNRIFDVTTLIQNEETRFDGTACIYHSEKAYLSNFWNKLPDARIKFHSRSLCWHHGIFMQMLRKSMFDLLIYYRVYRHTFWSEHINLHGKWNEMERYEVILTVCSFVD